MAKSKQEKEGKAKKTMPINEYIERYFLNAELRSRLDEETLNIVRNGMRVAYLKGIERERKGLTSGITTCVQ